MSWVPETLEEAIALLENVDENAASFLAQQEDAGIVDELQQYHGIVERLHDVYRGVLGGTVTGVVGSEISGVQDTSRMSRRRPSPNAEEDAARNVQPRLDPFHRVNPATLGEEAEAAAAANPADTGNAKGRTTEVVPLPRHVTFGMPDFFTTKLMFTDFQELDWAANTGVDVDTNDYEFRMNSIHDVNINRTGTQPPRWRSHFEAMYTHYTVLSCEFKIRLINLNESNWEIMWRTYGDVVPAVPNVSLDILKRDPHLKSKTLFGMNTHDNLVELNGFITHQDYMNNIQEVHQDASDQIWAETNGDPTLMHKLRIYMRRHVDGVANEKIRFDAKLIFTVQFRELKQAYQFNAVA